MSIASRAVSVLSLGCSCQIGFQIRRNWPVFAEAFGAADLAVSSSYFDFMITSPEGLAWALETGDGEVRRVEELIVDAEAPHWAGRGMWFVHSFRQPDPDMLAPTPIDFETRFEEGRSKIAHLWAKFGHLAETSDRLLFVIGNTQNDLWKYAGGPERTREVFGFTPQRIGRIKAALEARVSRPAHLLVVEDAESFSGDWTLDGVTRVNLGPPATLWEGDDVAWTRALRTVTPDIAKALELEAPAFPNGRRHYADHLRARGAPVTRFYLDIAPLQETEWTGIPNVAAKLAEQMLGDAEIEPRFFYNRHEIPLALIEKLLKVRSGPLLRWAAGRYVFKPALSDPRTADRIWGLHSNIKFARRLFPVEGVIVHDLTTIVTPQHHTAETNAYHQTKFFGDLMSSDVIFTVSHSTAADVADFYPETRNIPIVVSHLGVDWGHIPAALQADAGPLEDYLLVLGTLEPRKNVGIVLDLLKARPSLAEDMRIVFGGRVGWGNAFEHELEVRGLTALADSGRILQTGFITEAAKYSLFKHARAVIYPSVYEGFGLPVAEAISLGAPVVTTASSSLPEVGRDFAEYFVQGEVDSLFEAVSRALKRGHSSVSPSGETLEEWRRYFSWPRCYRTVKDGFRRLESARFGALRQVV